MNSFRTNRDSTSHRLIRLAENRYIWFEPLTDIDYAEAA
jgi:hypothetical protein